MFGTRGAAQVAAFACLLCLVGFGPRADADPGVPDFAYTESRVFTLDTPRGRTYRLTEEVNVSIQYLTPRATDLRSLPIGERFYAPVERLSAHLGGKKLGRDEVYDEAVEWQDVFLSGGRVHRIAPERTPDVGDELAYSYRRTYSDLAYLPVLHVPNLDQVQRYEIVVKHPEGVTVEPVVYAPRGTPYTVNPGARQTQIVFEGLRGTEEVPYFAHNGQQASVLIQIRDARGPLTPTAPNDFAAWYTGLVASASAPGGVELAALAESLRRDTPTGTVAAIHDHVRSTIRYIADARDEGAFVPRAPDLVLTYQYGDCKDRAFLVRELARQLDIDVDVVLISTVPEADFEGVHVGLFNHVINSFDEEDGTRTYFDPTHPYLAFGDLPDSDVDGQALVLTGSGAERLRVPTQDNGPALEMTVGALDLDAPETSIVHITVRGHLLGILRGVEAREGEQEEGNALSSIVGDLVNKMRLTHGVRLTDAPRERTYSAVADLSQFVIASPTKRYLSQTPFRAVPSEIETRVDDALPITLDTRPNLRLTLHTAPGTWTPDSSAVEWGSGDGPAHYSASAHSSDDGGAILTYEFRQRTRQLEGDARAAYIDLATSYLDAKREVFTFRSPTTD
ncbi:MAG: hypothetical protein Rubg2KO_15980 [Rubricoccaceae bacterium]